MINFNLTAWSLNHKQFIYFLVFVFFLSGIFAYRNLGRMEDPNFTIKQMVISVAWPGATARQMEEQVTDKIEKKLQDLPGIDYLKSYSTPGQTVIYVNLNEQVSPKEIRARWLEARNMVNDIRSALPAGVLDPNFNDRFDEVYGVVYTLTGDGYTYEEMREKSEKIRRILLGIPSVRKVQLLGVQTEQIYIEIENSKLARLGIDPSIITAALQEQNAMVAAGMLETASDNVHLRISGMFENLEDVQTTPIQVGGRTFQLGDIAVVTRAYAEPADPKMFYNGQPAIGISLAMEPGGNILTLGKNLDTALSQIKQELPAGLEINQTVNQPKVVESSIDEFVKSLAEAIVIVLIVSFASLGFRSGVVVALTVPLVIAITFTLMYLTGIDLQRISLGALIIALGLLVDDAIIAIEMMIVKLEQGWSRFDAACYAYKATAFPMLTGTLVTCAGFIPIAFSKGSASEFCITLFWVVFFALVVSWMAAVTVTPLLGYLLLKIKPTQQTVKTHAHPNLYDTSFYRHFKRILLWCMYHRKTVLAVTAAAFIGSIALLGLVKQEFFPASSRPEVIVQLKLQEGASVINTEKVALQFADKLDGDPNISYYTYHVGEGAPRFVLSFEPTFHKSNFAEFIIVAKDVQARNELAQKTEQLLNTEFTDVQGHVKILFNGPAADYPVMLRVKGPDHERIRQIAEQVRTIMAAHPATQNVNLNWNEKSKVMHLEVDQAKARALGLSSQDLAASLQVQLSGASIAEFRERDKTVGMVFRFSEEDRNSPEHIKDLNIHIGNGKYVPLDQIATIRYDAEEGLIYRRNLLPMIIVQAELNPSSILTGTDVTTQVYDELQELRSSLPAGYSIEFDGTTEESMKSGKFLAEPIPAMMLIITILLMMQLQSIPKMLLTLLTAPLGIIGVAVSLLLTGSPMGFVVQLGILALSGIIMRNSIILTDQIEQHLATGESLWDAIIDSTILRFRPIMLTASAAILAMIPLVFSAFWGPMAVAIGGGLLGATLLTLLVLPVMYATWYKAQPDATTKNNSLNDAKKSIPQ
ncbi:efflux RND transporter permease subunit [Pelosinus propionicus]|uniref:Multidrug efflux pump subunit AcrB n=1 Tax=Pelosinus propionicus DSM 13327 TaxID=1123291 RepID=A0A1I4M938_9FIRM|nr:efflux RND transporter permease subunit [Pelosinus propionicus]SFL99758.1 Multidrug efflux pump subunit AcrB [Pelosinus propionicus DSM 13327]